MGHIIFATGRRVTIATAITGNAGTSTYTCRLRSGPNGITVPASGIAGFLGTSQATGSNGFVVNASGQIRVYRSGTNLYGSTSALITTGVQFDYTLSHTAGSGAWDIFDNLTGLPTGESGTYTNAQLWSNGTNGLNQFGRSSNTNAVYLVGEMEIIAVTGLTNAQEYDSNLSGGTGLTWPTTSGSNQGTLDGFGATDADNWGGFGATYTLTADGGSWSYSGGDTTLAFNRKLIAGGASWSYQGASAELAYNRVLSADGGSYTYAGGEATLTYTTAGATYTLTAEGGSWTCAGGNASLAYNRVMRAEGGAYQYSGGVASLLFNRVLTASGGSWSYALADVNLRMNRVLVASGGAYAYSGGSASLTYSGSVILQINGYTVSYGNSAMSAAFGASPVAATYGDNLVRAEYGNV